MAILHSDQVEEVVNGVENIKVEGGEQEAKQPRVTKAQKRRVRDVLSRYNGL